MDNGGYDIPVQKQDERLLQGITTGSKQDSRIKRN
jgi:hypothetical protein